MLITLGLGLASCSLAGLYCNHADLSPRHAAILLGMTNTTGALPGIVGVAITGALLDLTGAEASSWSTTCLRCLAPGVARAAQSVAGGPCLSGQPCKRACACMAGLHS